MIDSYSFIHDNATPHLGFPANEFIENNINVAIAHPPNSPDLNPIEKCWGTLKDMVYDGESLIFNSVVDIRQAIHTRWGQITQEQVQLHIDNLFDKRLQACIDENGDYFD